MMRLWMMAVLFVAAQAQAGLMLHVSPDGNDDWTGKLPEANEAGDDGPLATPARGLERMTAYAAEHGSAEGCVLYLRGGAYHLAETLRIGPELTGTEDRPFLFRSYPGETARLVGGTVIDNFEAYEGDVLVADLSDRAFEGRFVEVYWEGARQTPARWPNLGEGDLPGGGWTFISAAVDEGDARKRAYYYRPERPQQWASHDGIEVSIWPHHNWWQTIAAVESIDRESGRITLADDLPYTIEPGRRFFFQHVREELDAPGEWYHDTEAQRLYFWPPENREEVAVVVPTVDTLLEIVDADHVTVFGLEFTASRGNGVAFRGSSASLLAKSVVEHVYGFGVTVNGGEAVRIVGNDIRDTGRGGIVLSGGDRKSLTTAGHQAENNHIQRFGRVFRTYQTGVNVQGVGNLVRHNLIHDAPHIGILLAGNEHLIEYNEIYDVCQEGSDNGAIYMGRDWTQRGIVIRYNKIHDVYGFGLHESPEENVYTYQSPHWAWGVYLDDCSSGVHVHGNIFYRVPLSGVKIGGGRDNNIENNIFVDTMPALHIDARWDAYPWDLMQERLEAMNPTEPPYSERYPELATLDEDPRRPANNRFVGNVIAYSRDDYRGMWSMAPNPNSAVVYNFTPFDAESTVIDNNLIDSGGYPVRINWRAYGEDGGQETIRWDQWRDRGFDENSVLGDAKFIDPENDHFELNVASDARLVGFPPLPVTRMGLYHDDLRASWPPPAQGKRTLPEHQTFDITVE